MEITNDFIIGLIEGEGCFNITKTITNKNYIRKDGGITKIGQSQVMQFRMVMHIRDYELLIKIKDKLGFGKVRIGNAKYQGKDIKRAEYYISNQKDNDKLINFIDNGCGFHGYKGIQYTHWRKLLRIDNEKQTLIGGEQNENKYVSAKRHRQEQALAVCSK